MGVLFSPKANPAMSATAAKQTFHFYKKNSSLGLQLAQSCNSQYSNKASSGSRGVSG